MDDNGDGVEDEVGRSMRIALTVATQLADKFARLREDLARDAGARSAQEARQLQARFEGERTVAVARLTAVDRPEWWDRADAQTVAGMHETAEQWKSHDPRVQAASETIAREMKERYGIDVSNPAANPADVRIALAQEELRRNSAAQSGPDPVRDAGVEYAVAAEGLAEADRLDARAATERADATRTGDIDDAPHEGDVGVSRIEEAAVLELTAREYEQQAENGGSATHKPDELRELAADARAQAQLDRTDAAPEQDAGMAPAAHRTAGEQQASRANAATDEGRATTEQGTAQVKYDSADRRQTMVADMQARGIPQESIDVRMRADIAHGRPATDVVRQGGQVKVPATNRGRPTRGSERPEQAR